MGFTLTGIVNSARPIVAEDNSYQFYAFDLVTSRGGRVACQVMGNDPQYPNLLDTGEQLVNHKVKVAVSTYSTSTYTQKDGKEVKQVRFRVTNVRDLGLPPDENELVGIISSARPIDDPNGQYHFLAIDIAATGGRGVMYACQMWDNDPQYVTVGSALAQLIDHKVRVAVVGVNVGARTNKDGSSQLQARFRISNLRDLGYAP